MVMLLIIGLVVLASGVLTLSYGVPIKDFSFGNTLIIAGTIATCTGFVLLGLAVVARQLRRIALGVQALSAEGARTEPAAMRGDVRFVPALRAAEPDLMADPAMPAPLRPAPPAQSRTEPVSAPRPSPPPSIVPEPVAATPAPATPRERRNLLFVSTRRERERERERAAVAEPAPSGAYSELTPPAAAEPSAPAEPPAPTPPSAPPTPTVVKSGAVDGMAYSLYSDGSIEAQLPEGLMRFASIAELRAHLESQP